MCDKAEMLLRMVTSEQLPFAIVAILLLLETQLDLVYPGKACKGLGESEGTQICCEALNLRQRESISVPETILWTEVRLRLDGLVCAHLIPLQPA